MQMLLAAIVVLASATAALAQYGSRGYDSFGGSGYGSTSYPTGRYVAPHYNPRGEYVGGHFTPDSHNLNPRDSSRPRSFNQQTRPHRTPSSRY